MTALTRLLNPGLLRDLTAAASPRIRNLGGGGGGGGAVSFNANTWYPIRDYTNTAFTELVGGTYANSGTQLVVQDDTTNYRFYSIAMTTPYSEPPANNTGQTADGSTGRVVGYQYSSLFFNGDGTSLFGTRVSSASIDRYDLGTAWDISTLTSASPDQELVLPETWSSTLRWAAFNSDGTKIWLQGTPSGESDGFWEYPLDTPYDIESYTSGRVTGPANGVDVLPASNTAISMSPGEDKLIGQGGTNGNSFKMLQINLTTPGTFAGGWTNTDLGSNFGFKVNEPIASMAVSPDAQNMMLTRRDASTKDSDIRIYQNAGDDAYMARFVVQNAAGLAPGGSADPRGLAMSADGVYSIWYHDTGTTGPIVIQTQDTPYDIDSINLGSTTTSSNVARLWGRMHMSDAGDLLIATDRTGDIWRATFSTPWDASTMSALTADQPTTITLSTTAIGLQFIDSGNKMVTWDKGNNRMVEFTLGTAYDVSSDTSNVTQSMAGSTALWDYFYGFNSDGTKAVFGLSTTATQSSLDEVYSYTCATPYDITTMTEDADYFRYSAGSGVMMAGYLMADGSGNDNLYYGISSTQNRYYQMTNVPTP